MKGYTRRQIIEKERKTEVTRFIIFVVLALACFIVLCMSCDRCGSGGDGEQTPVVTQSDTDDKSALDDEDIEFLRTRTSYPRLVSVAYPLPAGYEPPELTRLLGMPDGDANKLNFEAATAFYELRDAMIADGLAIIPLSGYRTYEEQVAIFNYNVQLHTNEGMTAEEAREYTERFVALPGTSEHQYGRSIDVTIDGTTNHDFHETEQGKWLIEHACEYGFIVRYPSDKTEITGINYEPWHLRYCGKEAAMFISEHGLCLEEYTELVLRYSPSAVSEQ